MTRKFLFAAFTALGLASHGAMAAPVTVEPPQAGHAIHAHYHVYYRVCSHSRWRLYQTVHCHCYAHELADGLRAQGYQTRVVHCD